jgi:hypothetical protein
MTPKADLPWPPLTAQEQIDLWEHREYRYRLRKHAKSQDERVAIAAARHQDVMELPYDEQQLAAQYLATMK